MEGERPSDECTTACLQAPGRRLDHCKHEGCRRAHLWHMSAGPWQTVLRSHLSTGTERDPRGCRSALGYVCRVGPAPNAPQHASRSPRRRLGQCRCRCCRSAPMWYEVGVSGRRRWGRVSTARDDPQRRRVVAGGCLPRASSAQCTPACRQIPWVSSGPVQVPVLSLGTHVARGCHPRQTALGPCFHRERVLQRGHVGGGGCLPCATSGNCTLACQQVP